MTLALSDHDWCAHGAEAPLCLLPLGLAELRSRLGLPPATGPAVLQLAGAVLRLQEQPGAARVQVWVRGDEQTPGRCLAPLCSALGLRVEELPWVAAELGPRPWLLVRLDDNGNRLPMWYFRERAQAEAVARDYAARGHKQAYEVEQAPGGGHG